jgi:regulator of protease activity HflC (stomatin/prohibitin superfamily)
MMIQYSRSKYYEKLLAQTQVIGERIKKRLDQARLLGEEFLGRYGINVRAIEVRRVVLPEGIEKATVAQRTAEYEKQATITRAEAEAKRIEMVYGKIQSFGDLGKLIQTLEAVKESPLVTSMTVQAVPGLAEVFKEVFQRSGPEDLTIKVLREDIQKLKREVKVLKEKKG